jgi:hypothetical protein
MEEVKVVGGFRDRGQQSIKRAQEHFVGSWFFHGGNDGTSAQVRIPQGSVDRKELFNDSTGHRRECHRHESAVRCRPHGRFLNVRVDDEHPAPITVVLNRTAGFQTNR